VALKISKTKLHNVKAGHFLKTANIYVEHTQETQEGYWTKASRPIYPDNNFS